MSYPREVTTGSLDLAAVLTRLATRRPGRTEANVQSDLHLFLTAAPFELDDANLNDIVLESPAGQRRRIDVEVGQAVFEVKRDLRIGNVRAEAIKQLAGYVRDRTNTLQQRYVGVLTDGAEWHLYHLVDDDLVLVSSLELAPSTSVDVLTVWIESVLGTTSRITPTPTEIYRRLGATSPAHDLDFLELSTLYQRYKNTPEVRLKRELWAKLLITALGTRFADEDHLFVEHTLLVATAEIIAHAVVGIDPTDPTISAKALLEGALFGSSQIGGVVEPDFFDWVSEIPEGPRFIRTLARRLSRFAWNEVEHDVMKVLYESVISTDTRKSLGEYYTPDWLASEIVESVVTDPLNQRVLDPGCGSGTFIFHAVRRYFEEADAQGIQPNRAMEDVTDHVIGVDCHPVAVTLARVTYLLAIGVARLRTPDRPPITIPVYLGDSMQWGQEESLFGTEALIVPTNDGAQLFAEELRFPDRILQDAGRFDRLVSELADKAAHRTPGSSVPSLNITFRRFAVHPDDQEMVSQTFATMCRLHDDGRDHIWGYYIRNLARPIWLAHHAHRVDALVGNPPWLAYKYMPATMQATFKQMSRDRRLWVGRSMAPNQDLSALFVERCIELYLREGGKFGFVMPLAVLSRRQFTGFRTGNYVSHSHFVNVAFDRPWDLHSVKPAFFPVPAAVVFGQRVVSGAIAINQPADMWSGRLPTTNASRLTARDVLTRNLAVDDQEAEFLSRYAERFTEGATIVPRVLIIVERQPVPPLGAGAGRIAVSSSRSAKEKRPWKLLPSLSGMIERQFIHPLIIGETVLPYRLREPLESIVPWDGARLLRGSDERLDYYPGLASWWRKSEELWIRHRSSDRLDLVGRIDYRHGLSEQFPVPERRVVYTKSGMYLAAACVNNQRVIVDQALYWAAASTEDEARFLTAILNSDVLTQKVRPLQARGQHNPRHFAKYVFRVPIPIYDPSNPQHKTLADLAREAERQVAEMTLPEHVSFEALRRRVRQAVSNSEVGRQIESLALEVLTPLR